MRSLANRSAASTYYRAHYQSDRPLFARRRPEPRLRPRRRLTTAGYAQPTVTVWRARTSRPAAAFSGTRIQARGMRSIRMRPAPIRWSFRHSCRGCARWTTAKLISVSRLAARAQVHSGIRPCSAAMAQSFRLPNVDERVGMAHARRRRPTISTCGRNVRTIYEAGFRVHSGPFDLQSSVYRMYLIGRNAFPSDHLRQHQSRSDAAAMAWRTWASYRISRLAPA